MSTILRVDGTVDARRVITGFKQGDEGNCASIAAIKCALMATGGRVLESAEEIGEGVRVKVRDRGQDAFVVLHADVERARRRARFVPGTDAALCAHAEFLFAVMVRLSQIDDAEEGNGRDLDTIIADLNDGMNFMDTPSLLGMADWLVVGPGGGRPRRRNRFLNKHAAAMAADRHHAWFVSRGVNDNYGNLDGRERSTSTLALVGPRHAV